MSLSLPPDSGASGADYLSALGALGKPRDYPAGAVIFSAGDPGDGFHIVERGTVSIRGAAAGQEERVLASIEAGDFFGEMAVLDEGPRSATAVAATATRTRFLSREEFRSMLQQHPEFALQLISVFSRRLRTLNQRYLDDLLQTERLATIGRLAHAAVHDFKNPLAVISLAAELVGEPTASPETRARVSRNILTQVGHMNSLLHELIEFTRSGKVLQSAAPLNFAAFVQEECEGLAGELADRRVTLRIAGDLPRATIHANARRLSRLLRNLAFNAADAMGAAGGLITLQCHLNGTEVITELTDTGPGIAPEITTRLFEPFATFGKQHGTGLGLSICKRIVEDHGGRIWVQATHGRGATFAFALPVA